MSLTTVAQEKQGSILGGSLLIAGSCIGAGMLGLPILTGMEGFFPSLIMFVVACIFMTSTALLIVEVNSWYSRPVNFITMITDILGPFGRVLCWITYLFLFYALLVAYIAGSGDHFAGFVHRYLATSFPKWIGSTFFVVLFGGLVFLGTRTVDLCNRGLMFAKIIAYLGLVVVGMSFVKPENLEHVQLEYAFVSLPILIISFGFHNMIPTLSHYLGGDVKRIKTSIIGGAVMALVIYLFWQIVVLGSLPVAGKDGILDGYLAGRDAASALNRLFHSYWLHAFSSSLAFFAILTSFLAQSLSLVHFLTDGMNITRKKHENVGICLMALLPPLGFAILYPQVFYRALNFAGGICAVVLFGMLPALMTWIGRKRRKEIIYQVRGGNALLLFIFLFASFIFISQLSQTVGFPFFPIPR